MQHYGPITVVNIGGIAGTRVYRPSTRARQFYRAAPQETGNVAASVSDCPSCNILRVGSGLYVHSEPWCVGVYGGCRTAIYHATTRGGIA